MTSVAEAVFGRVHGTQALAVLDWAPTRLVDEDDRVVAAALFRAAGRTCAVTPALGRLAAAAVDGVPSGAAVAVIDVPPGAAPAQDRPRLIGPLGLTGATAVIVLDRSGVLVGSAPDAAPFATAPLDDAIVECAWMPSDATSIAGVTDPLHVAGRVLRAARFAIANEILGACDATMQIALVHAADRRQFGSSIGHHQAVQHILAEAESQRLALEAACHAAVRTGIDGTSGVSADAAQDGALLKALAGRVGRIVMQNTLQVLGAIGFTEEHVHHRYLRRVMTLDGMFGSRATLVRSLGTSAALSRSVWQCAVLAADDTTTRGDL